MTLRLSGGRRLQSPPGATARPTAARVRQAVFNLLRAELPGCRWLDLCCGSGVMACEALQQGAAEVVAIERDRRIAAVARRNLDAVAASSAAAGRRPLVQVVAVDARRWLEAGGGSGRERGVPDDDAAPGRSGEVPVGQAKRVAPSGRDHDGLGHGPQGKGGPEADDDSPPEQGPAGADRKPGDGSGPESQPRRGPQATIRRGFDLIYLDPPWPAGLHGPLSEAVRRGDWIRPTGTLVWECPSEEIPPLPAGWRLRDQRRYGGSTVVLLVPA